MKIRDSNPEERDAVREVALAAFEPYAAVMGDHWELYRANIVATLSDFEPAAQIVAAGAGRVRGCVLLYPAGTAEGPNGPIPWPVVRLLAVPPGERGRGIGQSLMQECAHRARAMGAEWLALHTGDVMHAAHRLYSRLGFERCAEIDLEVDDGVWIQGYRLDLHLRG